MGHVGQIYWRIYLESSTKFNARFQRTKRDFLKFFNSTFGKIGRSASEEVLFELLNRNAYLFYCMVLMFVRRTQLIVYNKQDVVYKTFRAMSKDLYSEIFVHFGIDSVENLVANRRNRFIKRYGETDNCLCQMLR